MAIGPLKYTAYSLFIFVTGISISSLACDSTSNLSDWDRSSEDLSTHDQLFEQEFRSTGSTKVSEIHSSKHWHSYQRNIRSLRRVLRDFNIEALDDPPHIRPELFELGRRLAFDKILSGNRNIACMTCHLPAPDTATGDGRHLPLGEQGKGFGPERGFGAGARVIPRNSPPLFNLHLSMHDSMFWDNRIHEDNGTLVTPAGDELSRRFTRVFEFGVVSAQAMFPVTSDDEMRGIPGDNSIANATSNRQIWRRLMRRLGRIDEYVELFEAAYPGKRFSRMNFAHAANAIAAWEIGAYAFNNSPWERFVRGEIYALSPKQVRGALSFFYSGCANCHSGNRFSDFKGHNTAMPQFGPGKGDPEPNFSGHEPLGVDDFGLERVTQSPSDRYKFRTPTLFNVELTAPYGHTGATSSLRKFVRHYKRPRRALRRYDMNDHVIEDHLIGTQVDNIDEVIARIDPLVDDLNPYFRTSDIVAFLRSLTDPDAVDLSHLIPHDEEIPSGIPFSE